MFDWLWGYAFLLGLHRATDGAEFGRGDAFTIVESLLAFGEDKLVTAVFANDD